MKNILTKIEKQKYKNRIQSEDETVNENLKFFKKVGKKGRKINWDTVVREERDRELDKKIQEDFKFFDKIAQMGRNIDATKAVREDRDRDNT